MPGSFLRWLSTAAFLLVLFAPLSPAATPTPAALASNVPYLGDWVGTALIAVSVTFMIAAAAYMVGYGFGYPKVVDWSKNEFWEAALSGMLVVIIFFLVSFLGTVSFSLAGQNHIEAGRAYLNELDWTLLSLVRNAVATIQMYALMSSFWVRFFIPIPVLPVQFLAIVYLRSGTTLAVFAGFGEAISGVQPIFYLIWSAYLAMWGQKALLDFSANHMLSFFLPLGLIMRSFAFTRRLGATLIALSLTLYFVYPLSLALCKEMLDMNDFTTSGLAAAAVGGTTNWLTELFGMLTGQNVHAIAYALRPSVQLFVLVLVLTVLNFVVTVTAFRAISISLGGDPQVFGLGKLGA